MDELSLEKALPAGATPKDVADDITAKVSEGEFVIPAHVVRYLGVSRLQKMVEKAKKELEATTDTPIEEGKVVEQEDDIGEVEGEEALPAFANGGLVTAQPQTPTSTIEWEWQTTPSGYRIRVPKIQGKYVSSNFSSAMSVEGEGRNAAEAEKVGLDKDLKDWSVKDFSAYSRSVGTPQGRMGTKAANALVTATTGPFKGLIDKAVTKKDAAAREALNKMASTGVDQNGKPLSEEDKAAVKQAKDLADNPAPDSVGEKVTNAVVGSVSSRNPTKTAVKAADAATGGHLKGAVDKFKETVNEAIRGGVDSTYGQRKAKEEAKGLVDKPDKTDKTDPSREYGSSDRHSDGTPNVTGNVDQDREIEDSINR